jgi:hypothetical protein
MSRTYHATGTGSFTRASEVRRDRSAIRQHNVDAENRGNQKAVPYHGATEEHPEGKLTYEQAQKVIRNGDKIRTPDGILHKVTAENRDELIGRLGATVIKPAANEGRAKAGSNIVPRGTVQVYKGNAKNAKFNKEGRVVVKGSGARGKAQRITSESQRKMNQALPFNILQGIGQGSNRLNKGTGIGFQKVGPTTTYKASPNSKKTQISESKGNKKLNTRVAKVGGFAPKSTRAEMTKAFKARRDAGAKQRAADKAAGVVKPTQKRGSRKAAPEGEIRSTSRVTGVSGARINAPKGRGTGPMRVDESRNSSRKGGRSGRGRSK